MSTNIDTTDQQLYEILKHHINNDLPLALVRLGDGEIAILKGTAAPALRKRFCSYNGYVWNVNGDECLSLAKQILRDAIKNSDILGVLDKSTPIGKKVYSNKWVLPADFLQGNNPKICNHQVTRGTILGDITKFKEIINGKDIHIISSRTAALKNNNLAQRLGVNVSYTQVEFKSSIKNRQHIFDKIDKITEHIVLVGIGVKGKDIPAYLRDKGKVCLDWGATIDAWAGIASRPWFANLQKHCLIK